MIYKRGRRLRASVINAARSKSKIPIPSSMADFYAEVGDGLEFAWTPQRGESPFANHEFPKLAERTIESIGGISWRTEWSDSYDFRYAKDPQLAKRTASRMRKWLPFHDEGNGDSFCLDTSIEPAPVLFDQHDWYDGGTGENGHLLGDSLLEFYTAWAQVCFQFPSSLYWPSVFKKAGGVKWNSEEFQAPFRLPRS